MALVPFARTRASRKPLQKEQQIRLSAMMNDLQVLAVERPFALEVLYRLTRQLRNKADAVRYGPAAGRTRAASVEPPAESAEALTAAHE